MSDLRIQIIGSLDSKKTTEEIQSQLNKLTDKLNLNIGLDISQLNQVTKEIQNIKKQLGNSQVKLINEEDIRKSKVFFSDIESIKNKYKELGTVNLTKVFDPVTNQVKAINLEVQKANGLIEKMKFELAQSKGVHGITDGFLLTDLKEYDKTSSQMQNALLKSTQKRQQEEKKLAEQQAIAINKNIELTHKEAQSQKEVTKEIERQLDLYKRQKQMEAENLKRKYGNTIDSSAINSNLSKVNSVDSSTFSSLKELRDFQSDVNLGFKEIGASAKTSSSHVLGFGEALQTAMVKFCRLIKKW